MTIGCCWGCFYVPPKNTYKEPAPVPLIGVHAEGTICDFTAKVTLVQRYKNMEKELVPLEIQYIFPLDDLGAVCKFEAEINGKKIVTEVMDKEKAMDKYDDAIASGAGAYMLQQSAPDIAKCYIGNLPHGAECIIRITYVTELLPEEEKVRFMLPTTVAPLYMNAGVSQEILDAKNPPRAPANQVPYGLTIDLKVQMSSNIKSIASPSHPLEFELYGNAAKIRLGTNITKMDQDLVILVGQIEAFTPRLWVEPVYKKDKTVDGYTSMAVLFPSFSPPYQNAEFIFVVDQSGSMEGSQIANARDALQILLRSIPEGSKFNIVGFGSTFQLLYNESQFYNEATFQQATSLVSSMRADKGGTNIHGPLEWIFRQRSDVNFPRQIFLLTDGQIENTTAVLELVRHACGTTFPPGITDNYKRGCCTYNHTKGNFAQQNWWQCRTCNMVETTGLCSVCKDGCHANHDVIGPYFSQFFCDCGERGAAMCKSLSDNPARASQQYFKSMSRVFSLGIGTSVSHSLVNGLAKEGGGTAVYVLPGEKMESKVVGQLKLSLQPAIKDVSVDWGVPNAVQAPKNPPAIFNRSRLLAYAYSSVPPQNVTVKGNTELGQEVSTQLVKQDILPDPEPFVQKLFAKNRIRDLENSDNLSAAKPSVLETSLKYQILSSFTSFIGVEERNEAVEGTMVTRKVVSAERKNSQYGAQFDLLGSTSTTPFGVPAAMAPPTFGSAYAAAPSFGFSTGAHAYGGLGAGSGYGGGSGVGGGSAFGGHAAPSQAAYAASASPFSSYAAFSPALPPTLATTTPSFHPIMSPPPASLPPAYPSFNPSSASTPSPFSLNSVPTTQPASVFNRPQSHQPQQQQLQQQQLQQQQMQRPSGQNDLFDLFGSFSAPAPSTSSFGTTTASPFGAVSATATTRTPHERLQAVMIKQAFNGSWNLDDAFAIALGISLQVLRSRKPAATVQDQVWATALGLVFLELELKSLKDAWEMAAQKSTAFLQNSAPATSSFPAQVLLDRAREVIRNKA